MKAYCSLIQEQPIPDWIEQYKCGCQAEYERLAEVLGMCAIHDKPATTIHCTNPVKFERELQQIGREVKRQEEDR
jgi:hypothetical protein